MRWVLRHGRGVSPEVERVALVAGHVEPVAAIPGRSENPNWDGLTASIRGSHQLKADGIETVYNWLCVTRIPVLYLIHRKGLTCRQNCWRALVE
jgi:hypothetical protein